MSYKRPGDPLPEQVCGICRVPLDDEAARDWCLATLHPAALLKHDAVYTDGGFIEAGFVTVPDFRPLALVTARTSEARKNGIDIVFQCCGEVCGQRLREALESEISIYNQLGRD